jgi:hypothetical protein
MQTTTTTPEQTVARTILEQLGRGFSLVTGAKAFSSTPDSLSFRLPGSMTRGQINHVKIQLTPDDTYTLTFTAIRGMKATVKEVCDDIYFDSLNDVIERVTGLATRMPRVVFGRD